MVTYQKSQVTHDDKKGRGNWTGKLDFLLSTIGFTVGLGNIWRFPYRAYDSGGAVFLIPYVIFLVVAGLPLYFVELSFGQFGSLGPISIWKAVPIFKGIGYAMVVISALVCIYYNMIIAYSLYFLFASFTSKLPWAECKPEWSQYNCVQRGENYSLYKQEVEKYCESMRNASMTSSPEYIRNCTIKPQTPAAIYWEKTVLDISSGIDEGVSVFKWDLTLCLLLAWIMVLVCLSKGIKTSGKVVYVTAVFPYIVLAILLVRNCTLEGARQGIEYYMVPRTLEPLKDSSVWHSAATQIFYSLGIAFGGLETLASYNKFKNNIYRDAVLVSTLNCCTSVYAGFVIFSVLGHMSHVTGLDMSEVASYGPGLVFVAYPEGIAAMKIAPLWSILFFLMIITVGLDSQFAIMETVITAIVDEYDLNKYRFGKITVTAVSCVLLFILGLPQCTRAGIYVMNLFDWYSAGFSLFIVSIFEIVAISWIYGFKRFSQDIMLMVGNPCGCFKFWLYVYWWPCWIVITPGMIIFLIVYTGVNHTPVSFSGKLYPEWADGIGWGMVALALIFIPLIALVEYCKAHDFVQTMRKLFRPHPDWGPALYENRVGTRYEHTDDCLPVKGLTNQGYNSDPDNQTKYAQDGLPAEGFDCVANNEMPSEIHISNLPQYVASSKF